MVAHETLALLKQYVVPLALALLLALFGWVIGRWAGRILERAFHARKLDAALGGFLGGLLQYTILAAAVIAALGAVGIPTTSLVAVFASAGLAIGLALQGSLESFASGVMILVFRPFDLEHVITAAGQTGTVKDIGLFATTLHTPDNQVILVPNKELTKGTIVNNTALGTLRGGVPVTVAWGTDPVKLTAVLLQAASASKLVLTTPAPSVVVTGVTRSLDITLYVWAKSGDLAAALHEVRVAVHDAMAAARLAAAPVAVILPPA
jgi:small conductance mechanosensitive channel